MGQRIQAFSKKEVNCRGDFIYRQTWLATNTNEKWRWFVVGFWAIAKFVIPAIIFCAFTVLVIRVAEEFSLQNYSSKTLNLSWKMIAYPAFFFWMCTEACFGSRFIVAARSFYCMATDMMRMRSNKLIARFVYLLSGSLAVGFAVLTWKTRRFRGEKFSGNELDILGRIFSKAKFWKWAKEIYLEIGLRYAARFQGKFNSKEVSVSFALANKWMQGDPDITSTKLGFHRIVIKETLEMYEPHLEPEVMSKLCEGLGDSEVARRERIKNATKFS